MSVLDVKLWYSLSNFISLESYQKVNNVGGLTLKYVLYNFSSILILEFYQIRDFFWKMKFIYTSFSVANYFLRIYLSFARTKKITFSSISLYLMNTQITSLQCWKTRNLLLLENYFVKTAYIKFDFVMKKKLYFCWKTISYVRNCTPITNLRHQSVIKVFLSNF